MAAALSGCGRQEAAPAASETRPPNILLFLVDTLRADALGAYGNEIVETPAIDRFAREGTLFERAFAPTSWTRPSVTSILTGLHPSVHGVERRGSALPSSVAVLPEILREHGYRTGFLATNPNVGSFFGYARGFDDFIELYERREQGVVELGEFVVRSDRVIDRAKDWMEESERPFFLVVFVIDPHSPYDPPPDFDRYAVQSLDDSRHGPRDPRPGLYYGEVAFVDECFGRLMAYLEDRGITEETISIFASDHGEEFFDHGKIGHGKNLYDESLHVPLLVRWPGKIASGRRVGTPVELMDLMSTILELTGLPAPPIQDGRSLFDESAERQPFLASLKLDGQREWSIRDHPWKLIVEGRTVKLFDLSKDPDEVRDVSSEYPDRARELGRWVGKREESDRERGLLARQGRPPGEAPAGELSEDAEKALRELGYIK
ncbi:MAG TPA: sulfatase [Vicinamibacteria bacterium]|nr:sulfatase [Vicinamibacteria bacterium]